MTNNKSVLAWLDEMKELVTPDEVVWIDGSEEQLESLRKQACETGEMIKLNQEKLPGCYLHRTAINDVARVEGRTFICSRKEEDAGPTNHWMEPQGAYKMLFNIARGSYKGRTMYVIPYSMGPIGSPLAKIGLEVTDSIYVVLNMAIMTRVGQAVLDVLGDSEDSTISSASTPVTAATCCWARSASPCALPPTWARTKAGWPSTCSSWALRIPRAR